MRHSGVGAPASALSSPRGALHHLGALLFYRVTEAAGAVEAMSALLSRISPHRAFNVLLLAWASRLSCKVWVVMACPLPSWRRFWWAQASHHWPHL
jgi:hypothetical protein